MDQQPVSIALNELLNKYNLWKYVEVKACLIRYNKNDRWKPRFIHLKFLPKYNPPIKINFKHDNIKLIHKILTLTNIETLLDNLINKDLIILDKEQISIEEYENIINFDLKVRTYMRDYYYIDNPCWLLSRSSNFHSKHDFQQFERDLRNTLALNDLPYEDLNDLCNSILKVKKIGSYSPNIRIIIPLFLKIDLVESLSNKKILISLYKYKIKKSKVLVNIFGKSISGEIVIREQIRKFKSDNNTTINASYELNENNWETLIISLYFDTSLVDQFYLRKIDNDNIVISREEKIEIITPLSNEQIKRKKDLISELLSKSKNNVDKNQKGNLLEKSICELLQLIPGITILDIDSDSKIEEIDIIIKNKNTQGIWKRFESILFVECKNWSTKVSAKEIRDFEGKLRNYWLHGGIFVSIKGFKGNERSGAKGQIKLRYMQEKMLIITIEDDDINRILNCHNIFQLIEEKIDSIYTTSS